MQVMASRDSVQRLHPAGRHGVVGAPRSSGANPRHLSIGVQDLSSGLRV
jgi:hypothetical protein